MTNTKRKDREGTSSMKPMKSMVSRKNHMMIYLKRIKSRSLDNLDRSGIQYLLTGISGPTLRSICWPTQSILRIYLGGHAQRKV